jgi:Tfp pilus assembly major pilin PilA
MLIGLLIFVAILAIVLGLKYVRRTPVRAGPARAALERQNAKDIVDQAVRDLYAGDDARSVVIRTYQMMSRLLRGRVQDAETLTPREMAAMAEARLGWPEQPTKELTYLFEEAWYSNHELREESKESALRCLRQISSQANVAPDAQRRGADASGP